MQLVLAPQTQRERTAKKCSLERKEMKSQQLEQVLPPAERQKLVQHADRVVHQANSIPSVAQSLPWPPVQPSAPASALVPSPQPPGHHHQ